MAKRLDKEAYAVEYDGLIASNVPSADASMVKLAQGTEILKRGTVVSGTPGEELAPLSEALTESDAAFILTDDTDVTAGPVNATAYRTGHFATNRLNVAEGYTITAGDKEYMRRAGILLSDALEY